MQPFAAALFSSALALAVVFRRRHTLASGCFFVGMGLLAVVPLVQERIETLSRSVTLLADTTESCFKALAMQLQFIQSQGHRVQRAWPVPRHPVQDR